MPAHQLDETDAVARGHRLDPRAADRIDRGRVRRQVAEAAVDEADVVVDRLGHPDHRDPCAAAAHLVGDPQRAGERAVAADDEQHADAVRLEVVDQLGRVLRAARGAEHRAAVVVDVRDRLGREHHRLVPVARDQPLEAVAEPGDATHAVAVPQLEHDAADHVVQARGEPAAGHDPAAQRARIEEDPVARAGELERGQRVDRAARGAQRRQRVVDQHAVGRADVVDRRRAEVGGDRRGEARRAEGLDRDVVGGQRAVAVRGALCGHRRRVLARSPLIPCFEGPRRAR